MKPPCSLYSLTFGVVLASWNLSFESENPSWCKLSS